MSNLTAADLADAYQIWLTAGWNDGYQISLEEFVRSWQTSLVTRGIWDGRRLVAIGRANSDGVLYAMIHDVVVLPDRRRQGLGTALVNELVDELKLRNVRSIQLMAAVDQTAFYRKLGFRPRPDDRPGMEYDWLTG